MPKTPKSTSKMVRVLIQLPEPMKRALDSLKDEGYTASSYLRFLLKNDLQARRETGWVAGKGWINRDKILREREELVRRAEERRRKEEARPPRTENGQSAA